MYLKKIIATGFKSFADKTVLDLSNGITGIVGPNGSGKSNVVDAVRWVLGEQSVKSLRGDGNMTDVIFSGSKSRNSMNMASVTLIFDNTDKYLNLDYTEVSIRRRVYKDGTNEYSINDEKCRLKDITDLFLDSGIAKESFNIISQGKVEEIISSKPENRRIVFEEAASVLKYRKRKEEALRKLERTHDNLDRVNDIRKELESQVEPLRLQKEKALIYKEKSENLKNIEIALMATDIQNINFKYQESKKKIEQLTEELLSLSTSSSTGEAKIVSLKKEIISLDEEIASITKIFLEQTKEVEQASSKKAILLERQKYEVSNTKVHENIVSLKIASRLLESKLVNLFYQESLRTQKNILQVAMNGLQEGLYYYNVRNKKMYLSEQMHNFIQTKDRYISEFDYAEMIKDSDQKVFFGREEIMNSGNKYDIEYTINLEENEILINEQGNPYFNKNGELGFYICTINKIVSNQTILQKEKNKYLYLSNSTSLNEKLNSLKDNTFTLFMFELNNLKLFKIFLF